MTETTVKETQQPKVQTGELVQLRQFMGIDNETREKMRAEMVEYDPVHWIYAMVMDVLPDGRIRLRVDHPGNRWHGEERIVSPDNVRTEADVAALASTAQQVAEKKQTKRLREVANHFFAQQARMADANQSIKADAPPPAEGSDS